jgi:GDPmannose 4,6-dehydratase
MAASPITSSTRHYQTMRVSFELSEHTVNVDTYGPLRLLEAIREESHETTFYQASSSELFGQAEPGRAA